MNILIIGATSGIGRRLWEHYVSSGHNVIVVGRRKELLDNMARNCPEHTLPVVCDISQTDSFDKRFGIYHSQNIDTLIWLLYAQELENLIRSWMSRQSYPRFL